MIKNYLYLVGDVGWMARQGLSTHYQFSIFIFFSPLPVNPVLKPIIRSVFLTRKSRGGRLAIGWQAGARRQLPIVHPPRYFRVRKCGT